MTALPMRASALTLTLLAGCTSDATAPDAVTEAPVGNSEIIEVGSAEALVESVAGLGKDAVVLNFWATWCGPCKAEFPVFVAYDAEMESENVEVRFVSVDDASALPDVRAFLDAHGVSEASYVYTGTTDVVSQLNPFQGGAIPVTMVLDGDGILKDTHVGTLSRDALAAKVDAVRRGETPDRS